MKAIGFYPKDIHVRMEIPLSELIMIEKYVRKSMPFYNKVVEDYDERKFLEDDFLPLAKDIIEQMEKLNA